MSYFEYKNKNIYYNEIGNKENKLVLLHGNTASSKMFETIIDKYKKDYEIIIIDFLGCGKSDRVDKLDIDLWYDEAMQVISLLDLKQYKKVNIIGTSGGALVGINVALERPDLVHKLIADSFEGEQSLDEITQNIIENRNDSKNDENAKNFYYFMNGEDWEEVVDADTQAIYEHSKTIKRFFHKDLEELTVPVLFTGSKEDEFLSAFGKDYYEKLFKKLIGKVQDGDMYIFEHGSHPAMLSNMEEFVLVTNKFINR